MAKVCVLTTCYVHGHIIARKCFESEELAPYAYAQSQFEDGFKPVIISVPEGNWPFDFDERTHTINGVQYNDGYHDANH